MKDMKNWDRGIACIILALAALLLGLVVFALPSGSAGGVVRPGGVMELIDKDTGANPETDGGDATDGSGNATSDRNGAAVDAEEESRRRNGVAVGMCAVDTYLWNDPGHGLNEANQDDDTDTEAVRSAGELYLYTHSEYNADGDVTLSERYTPEGRLQMRTELMYDGEGRINRSVTELMSDAGFTGAGEAGITRQISIERYEYGDDGRLVRQTLSRSGEATEDVTTDYYTSDGADLRVEILGEDIRAYQELLEQAKLAGTDDTAVSEDMTQDSGAVELIGMLSGGVASQCVETSYTSTGEVYCYRVRSYDAQEMLLQDISYFADGKIVSDFQTFIYESAEASTVSNQTVQSEAMGSRLSEVFSYDSGGELSSCLTYQYRADGNLEHLICTDADGVTIWTEQYDYDSKRRLVRKEQQWGDRSIWHVYGYDREGYLTRDIYETGEADYFYDEAGRLIRITYLRFLDGDAQGQPVCIEEYYYADELSEGGC